MNHCFIMLCFSFPSHKQAPKLVVPGMCSLNHPSPRRVFILRLDFNFPAMLYMQDVVSLQYSFYYILIIIAFIQAEMMQAIDYFLWSSNDNTINRRESNFLVVSIGSSYNHRKWSTSTVCKHTSFRAAFSTIYRAWAGSFPTQRGFRHCAIHGLPFPINPDLLVVILKHQFPSFLKDAGFHPLSKPSMHSRAGSILLPWNCLPLASSAQDVENAVEDTTVRSRWATNRASFFSGPRRGAM